MLLNPKNLNCLYNDEQSRHVLQKTAAFFEKRGKKKLKEDDHERVWYSDFLEFVKNEKIFFTLLTPAQYGDGTRWDTWRNCQMSELLGFYGLAYWYTWQVTILGLGPIWMSGNEEVKKKTAEFLKQGGIFAFGLSEKEHGADLYSSEMTLVPQSNSQYLARGSKYYIGNANRASFVSTFGKIQGEGKEGYVFFVVDPKHEKYELIQNVCNSQNYVAEYKLSDYPITEKEILSKGSVAWDTALNTVNVGKFNLGWASIGMCTHAFYEAINHASKRHLFDHAVTDFVHIRQLFTDAYCRLLSMKLFALRASDYMRAASPEDRRYLLYNPMVKMKVTTQGEEVVDLLWDVIAAKGFEKNMYFESVTRDIRALPKLEGTVHVNMALVIKFMGNYFFKSACFPDLLQKTEPVNDDFLFSQGPTKGLSKIQFHDYRRAYDSVSLPNVSVFKKQIRLLKTLLILGKPNKEQASDFDFLLNLGELFSLVVYGQLLIESAKINAIEDSVLDQIFDFMVRDFSKYALRLYSKTSSTKVQMFLCRNMIKKPMVNRAQFEKVWKNHVATLKDVYTMPE